MAYGLLKVIKEIECLLLKEVVTKYTSNFFFIIAKKCGRSIIEIQ